MIQEMQSPNIISHATNRYRTGSAQRGRSRSPASGSRFPLPQKPRAPSLDTRMRPHSPPLTTGHSSGRFPSPGSVRHKFVREDVKERRHTYDARSIIRQSSPQSPNIRLGTRDDAPYPRSPDLRRHSDNYQNWARNAGSPNTPREPLAQRLSVSTAERTRSVGGTVNYHGLRDVPRGPRPKARDCTARSPPRPKKRDFIAQSPCIFISFDYLPDLPRMIKHLYGMLGTEFRPQNVYIDESGWNLIFENSPAGLERLARCFDRYHDELLFSQYELHMQCYPHGKQPRPQQDTAIDSSGGTNGSSVLYVPHERPYSSVIPRLSGFEGRQLTYHESTKSLHSNVDAVTPNPEKAAALTHTSNHALPNHLFGRSSDTTRTHEVPPMCTSKSLLSLRSDRDETGSMGSAVTRSDGSRIKRDRCHRCDGEAVPGSSALVRCSTCPRRYHRRCHQDFPIPTNLTETPAWSCASCVKKEMASKEDPKQDNQKPPSKPEELVSNADPVPEDAPDKSQSEMLDDHGPIVTNGDEALKAQLQILRSDSKSPRHDIQQKGDPTTNAKSGTGDEHAALSDADDLVARSFAAAKVQSRSKPPSQKPGKLRITRTKLRPNPPIAETQQSQGENQPDQNGSFPSDSPVATLSGTSTKATSMNGAVGRGTAADLRALAHERHRTAIKNGAEGNFASEEQRLRHNALKNASRSSPAHQSPSETAAPQKSSTMVPDSSAPAVAKHVTEREIPESPDEARCGEASSKETIVNPRILALLQPTEIAFVPPSRQTSNVNPTQDEKSPVLMRPRAPSAVVRCQNCQKTIPKDPTGKKKLCSGCKRDAAAATGSSSPVSWDAKAAPPAPVAPLQASFAPVANIGHSPQMVVESAKTNPRSEEVIGTNQQQQDPSVSHGGTGRVACDTCRKHNTSCNHRESVTQALTPITSNEQGDYAARPDKPTRGTTSDVVDDASLAQKLRLRRSVTMLYTTRSRPKF